MSGELEGVKPPGVCDRGWGKLWVTVEGGRTPNANAAASEAGRFAASEEMIFFKNL